MRSLTSSDGNNWGMVTNQNTGWGSAGSCKDGQADKCLKIHFSIMEIKENWIICVANFAAKNHFDL